MSDSSDTRRLKQRGFENLEAETLRDDGGFVGLGIEPLGVVEPALVPHAIREAGSAKVAAKAGGDMSSTGGIPIDTGADDVADAAVSRGPFGPGRRPEVPHRADYQANQIQRPGNFVGHYQLIREIGRGGMGEVFLARDTRLGRLVALKFLNRLGPLHAQRLMAEARATARCQHDNIVIIYEVDEFDGAPFMALEYLKGQTLRSYLSEHAGMGAVLATPVHAYVPVPRRRAIEIMIPVVRALVHAHSMNIIHRDLKPENIILTDAGTVKVLDFGLAKPLGSSDYRRAPTLLGPDADRMLQTKSNEMVGTLPYMSPEQVSGGVVDHRSDIWACGIILHELVTGRHPLEVAARAVLKHAIADRHQPVPSVRELMPELGKLAGIIDRCLIKNTADRCESAVALLAELEALRPRRRALSVVAPGAALGAASGAPLGTASGAALGTALSGEEPTGDESPFAGLAAFQESHADLFFGRSNEIAAAVARLRTQPIVAIVGPSGTGKSSLVRAGVIPMLKRLGEGWDAHTLRPGRHPLESLARILEGSESSRRSTRPEKHSNGHERSREDAEHGQRQRHWREADRDSGSDGILEDSYEHLAIIEHLRHEPGLFGRKLRDRASRKLRRTLIFIDQFEELYTLGAAPEERTAFLDCLLGAADDASSPLRVMLSIRSDFLDPLAEDGPFAASVTSGLLFLPPIGRKGLREALVRPVESVDYRFESSELVERMLGELDSARGALPLLQFTAAKLWEMRDRQRRVLDTQSYDQLGGVAGALASHADAVLASMNAADQRLARQISERLVTPENTRAIVSMGELRAVTKDPNALERVVQYLANARLLDLQPAVNRDSDGVTVELIHESLIDGWPTFRHWLEQHREDVKFLARLRNAAKQWQVSGHSEGILWRGEVARAAQRWHARYQGQLTANERRYLEATFSLARRDTRIRQLLVGGSIGFLSVLVVLASVALIWIRSAEQEATHQAEIVQAQLEELQRKERILRDHEGALRDALVRAEAARRAAEASESRTQTALDEAEFALAEAEAARDVARRSRDRAARASRAEKRVRADLNKFIKLGPHESEGGIRFNYRPGGSPDEVYLAGSFNGWNPGPDYRMRDDDGDGVYSITVRLGSGLHQYKFWVDGQWRRDPNAPGGLADGYGGMNGVVRVP